MRKRNDYLFMFDIDGVVANTPHEDAWRIAACKWNLVPPAYKRFHKFYVRRVAGEPGLIGAYNILEKLAPAGGASFFQRKSIFGKEQRSRKAVLFRNLKQKILAELLKTHCEPFWEMADFIARLSNQGFLVAAVSSSENADAVLSALSKIRHSRIKGFSFSISFDTYTLGAITFWRGVHVSKEAHYALAYGKALAELKLKKIPRVVVIEDAPNSVRAVKSLGFFCLGVYSDGGAIGEYCARALLNAGADLVLPVNQFPRFSVDDLIDKLK